MLVHALTPSARPENLPQVAEALAVAHGNAPDVDLQWHVSIDQHRQHVGGWALRNRMLDRIDDGWIWLLDDDTLAHPDVLARAYANHRKADVVVWSQDERPASFPPGRAVEGELWNGELRDKVPSGDSVFDAGMAVFQRKLLGAYRFELNHSADGYLWDFLLGRTRRIVYLDEVLCHYNRLRPGKWG